MISAARRRYNAGLPIANPAILAALFAMFCAVSQVMPRDTPAGYLRKRGFSWHTEETAHFNIHYEAHSFAERKLEALVRAHEGAIPRILEILGESAYPEKIHIFAVENRARMKALTGREIVGQAIGDQGMICCVFSESLQAVGAHEVMHVISFKKWGGAVRADNAWLHEGLAVYSDDNWRGLDLHALAKYLRDSRQLAPLERLMGKITSYPGMIMYPECGSYVKFLYERYGREKLKALWQARRADLGSIYGKSPSDLEAEWQKVIAAADARDIRYDPNPR